MTTRDENRRYIEEWARDIALRPVGTVGCAVCGGTGYEWRDYWSDDAEPCRNGCGDAAASSATTEQAGQ